MNALVTIIGITNYVNPK